MFKFMREQFAAILTIVGVVAAILGATAIHTGSSDSHSNEINSDIVATLPASAEDALAVDYSSGEWLFSDPTTGQFTAVRDSHCELSEDSCSAEYSDGSWKLTRVVK